MKLHGASDSDLASYYYESSSVRELAESMVANGYFPHEPLIVVPKGENYIVVEGNRRLTAIRLLLGHECTKGLGSPAEEKDIRSLRRTLTKIPCAVVLDRESIDEYIGFRHIGGQKTWSPEAKARFLVRLVKEAAGSGSEKVFRDVGRKIGSNTQGVRNPVVAYMLLDLAREEFGIDVAFVERHRFGVWHRLSTVSEVREFIGFEGGSEFTDIERNLSDVESNALQQVISDLTPGTESSKAVLSDSRDANVYGLVLQNKQALETLRDTNDLSIARIHVEDIELADRIDGIRAKVEALKKEVMSAQLGEKVIEATKRLSLSAKTLHASAVAVSE